MKKNKKLFISLGILPVFLSFQIACSQKKKIEISKSSPAKGTYRIVNYLDKKILEVGETTLVRDSNFGLKNWQDKELTQVLNNKEYRIRTNTGIVFAPHFKPIDIKNWEADSETDGEYVRSKIPVAKRKVVLEKSTETKGLGQYYPVDTMRDSTSNSMSGTMIKGDKNSQIIQGLQYMNTMIAFGGSVGEGVVYIPRAQDIDAYHRMGIKVHATVFFAPFQYGGVPQHYIDFMGGLKDDNKPIHEDNKPIHSEKVIDKLIEMAKYYGFDGWFINDENSPPMPWWTNFLKKWHTKSQENNLEISYYTNSNSGPVFELGKQGYDIWFNDFYRIRAEQVGISPQKSPLGFDPTGGKSSQDAIQYVGSNSFWTYREWENGKFFQNEIKIREFLNGVDDSKIPITDPRKSSKLSMSYHFNEYTPFVSHKSFASSFSTGEGAFYNFKGSKISSPYLADGYSNMSLQDYLPTWKFWVDIANNNGVIDSTKIGNTGINVKHIETPEAWMGSHAIKYSGDIGVDQIAINKLFGSEITIKDKDLFSMMYKGSIKPSLSVRTYDKDNDDFKQHILEGIISKDKFNNDYKKITFDISALKEKLMTSFGVAFKNTQKKSITLNDFILGEISFDVNEVNGKKINNKFTIEKIVNGGEWHTESGKNIRLRWEANQKNIKAYFIYYTDEKFDNKKLISITNTPSAILRGLKNERKSNIILVPVDSNNKELDKIMLRIYGDKLNLLDESKWSHTQPSKTQDFGVETQHGFVDKISDGEGGVYLVNDEIKVMHLNKFGILKKDDQYSKIVFKGKSTKGVDKNRDGKTFASIFVDNKKRIFISRKNGQNGLYVYGKNMKAIEGNWLSLRQDKFVFTRTDEYIAKMFNQSDGSLVLVSSHGNIKKITSNGVLDVSYSDNIFPKNENYDVKVNGDFKISILKIGDSTLVSGVNDQYQEFTITLDVNNTKKVSQLKLGQIVATRYLDDTKVMIASVYDGNCCSKKCSKIKISKLVISKKISGQTLDYEYQIPSPHFLHPNDFKSATFSNDGKKLYFRSYGIKSFIEPGSFSYVKANSYIDIMDLSKLSKDSTSMPLKTLYTQNAAMGTDDKRKYGGNFKVMLTLKSGNILYGTSDLGRVGIIDVKSNPEKVSLARLKHVAYKFQRPDGKKIKIKEIKVFFTNNLAKTPFD